jgi:hypothetical protein
VENDQQPARKQRKRRYKPSDHAQRFLVAYGSISSFFRPHRHRPTTHHYRQPRDQRFATWRAIAGVPATV